MKTRYGNWIFASGGDKVGATNVGVPVGRVKISLFIGTAVPINRLIFTLPTGTPTFVAPTLSPPDANIQFPYLVFISIQVANNVRAINHITDGGIPVATGIPPSVIWFIALTLFATWILMKTRYGNWIFASGGDKVGATNVGVPVGRVKISLFIGTAVASTIFACIQVLDAGSADTMRGTLKELEAIAAAVVGGCLLTGGYGSAIGAALGAIIFGTVSMGIFYTDVDTDWFKVFLGAMMLIAVVFNNYIRKKVTETK